MGQGPPRQRCTQSASRSVLTLKDMERSLNYSFPACHYCQCLTYMDWLLLTGQACSCNSGRALLPQQRRGSISHHLRELKPDTSALHNHAPKQVPSDSSLSSTH